jgi:hypothetical protein
MKIESFYLSAKILFCGATINKVKIVETQDSLCGMNSRSTVKSLDRSHVYDQL